MRPRAVVGVAVATDRGPRLGGALAGARADLLVPHRPPGALDGDGVAPPVAAPRRCPPRSPVAAPPRCPPRAPPRARRPSMPTAISASCGPAAKPGPVGCGPRPVSGDPRPAVAAERLLQRLDAQAGRQRGRRPPGHPGSRPGQALRLEGRAVAPPRSPRPGPPRRRHHADLARSVPSARARPDPPGRLCVPAVARSTRRGPGPWAPAARAPHQPRRAVASEPCGRPSPAAGGLKDGVHARRRAP